MLRLRTLREAVYAKGSRPLLSVFLALVLVVGLGLGGASRAQDYQFSSVVVEGNERVDTATVLRYAGIARGEALTAGQLNDAAQRIQGAGLFEEVAIDPQGSTLVIRVREFPTINVVSIEGNRRIKDDKILEVVQSQSRRVYSPSLAEEDAAAITDLYSAQGRIAATVTPQIIRRDGNRVDLVFEVREGRVVEIERIAFVGNRSYSDRRLRQVLETKQAGLLRNLIKSDTYIAERIDFDKQLLTDFYMSRGYADFQVLDATVELARERDGFFVTFTISEGQSFRIGTVETSSEVEGIDPLPFAAVNRMRSGVTYNPAVIENNVARMENLALREGLNFIRVEPRITRRERDGLLDVNFTIVRGPRIFVERIDIEGNTTTRDEVIRRQFRTVEGDPFNPREIRASAERIRALGFFSDAQVNTEEGSSNEQVLVNVDVVEQPTGSLSLGASYSVGDGVGVNLGFQETNFLGRGQTVGVSVAALSDSTDILATFTEPGFLGRDLSFRTSLFYNVTEQSDTSEYDTNQYGFRTGLIFPIGEMSRFDVRYELSSEEVTNVSVDSSAILKQEESEGELISSTPGYTYTYDTRNTGLNPLGGVVLRFGQDFSGLGGDVKSIATNAYGAVERKIWNEEVTLRASLEGSVLNMLDDQDSLVINRYFANGRIRGFETNGLGPRDLTAPNQDALGGNMMAVARVEAEFPLGLPEEYGIKGGLFVDTGSVWSLNNVNGTGGPVDDSFHLRAVVGFSIFWTTPIGPLRFNFTNAFIREDYDKPQNFDLAITTTF